MMNLEWYEGPLMRVPRLKLFKLINSLTLAHLELSVARREIQHLNARVHELESQRAETQTATTA